jgi:hypothetical protein
MDETLGQLSSESALAVVRTLAIERRTGILELRRDAESEAECFYFVGGELYLGPGDPLALALQSAQDGSMLGSDGTLASAASGESALSDMWFSQAVERFQAWVGGEYRFIDDPTAISTDLVGPLPTFSVVMAGAVANLDEFGLLRLLGGDKARLAVAPASMAPASDLVQLDPHEAFFLSRMERPVSVKDLLQQSDLDRFEGLQKLCRLHSAGLICKEEDLPETRPVSLLDGALLDKFSTRIAESLERQPLQMDVEEHRQRIASLLGRLGGMTYYELLGIGVGASSEEIHDAYSGLARVVHPCHANSLGFLGKEGGMQLLFEKATEAYLTLNDRDRSRRYLREIGSPGDLPGRQPTAEVRREEVVEMAEENFRRAKAMVARDDPHFAVELLQQAVRVHPKAEYYLLLGRCQARNPRWLQKAVASYGRALQLEGENLETRLELARILEGAGEKERASREYREILERQPSHVEASQGLQRLQSGPASAENAGWMNRFLALLPKKRQ